MSALYKTTGGSDRLEYVVEARSRVSESRYLLKFASYGDSLLQPKNRSLTVTVRKEGTRLDTEPRPPGSEKNQRQAEAPAPQPSQDACVAMWGRRFRLPCHLRAQSFSHSRQGRGSCHCGASL